MNSKSKEVFVADLELECTYQKGPSDWCGAIAKTSVEMPDGTLALRCSKHRGLTEGSQTGPFNRMIHTTQNVPDYIVVPRIQR
jgi:hypothetical protein